MSVDGILVLESTWSRKLTDQTSVRPFIEGWAREAKFRLSYRMYYDQQSLSYWLDKFSRSSKLAVCYIAGHGDRGRLCGLETNINLGSLAKATHVGLRRSHKKGILFGSCEVGCNIETFLDGCSSRISWAAGYTGSVPWTESTCCDLVFLEYLLRGRHKRKNGKLLDSVEETNRLAVVRDWLVEDFSLAKLMGFVITER